ncbi:MAG: HAMP domain-containing histidine kinase, partial [Rhizobacter sp.]|nr:HAMP domain-containing histidine kinase [Rhizobacter sp.]
MAYRIAVPRDWQATELLPDRPTTGKPAGPVPLAGGGAARPAMRQSLLALGGICAGALTFALAHSFFSGSPGALVWWLFMATLLALVAVYAWLGLSGAAALAQIGAQGGSIRQVGLVTVFGLAWGVAPWWLGVDGALSARLMLAVMLLAVAGAGAYLLSANRWSIMLWLALVLGPLLASTWGASADESTSIAVLVSAAACAIAGFALRRQRLLREARQTQTSNDTLVRELRQQVALVEQANRDKSRFLAAASHDLRQPMHALGLFAASLEKSLADTSLQPTVAHMLRAVDALEQSCSAMLDLSKLDAGVVEPNLQSFPIRDVFRRLHMHCAGQAEELGLALRFKPGGKIVTSDPQLLERVLGNLIHNSIRYTNEGGIVVLVRNRARRIS